MRYGKAVFLSIVAIAASAMPLASETFDNWREAAAAASTIVEDIQVDGESLVTDVEQYDPGARVIHHQNAEIEYPVERSDRFWRSRLTAEQYEIIRHEGTERPFANEYDANKERGIYYSRATGQPLFHSDDKYDSRTGWPSFTKPITPDAVAYKWDTSFFSRRIEVVDSLSGAHLGHVFNDGPAPTGQRYCMNSAALIFVPEGGDPPELLLPE